MDCFDHHREDWEARIEAMADYADYARKRDKENALTERGEREVLARQPAETREVADSRALLGGYAPSSASGGSTPPPRSVSADKHGGRVGKTADSGSAPKGLTGLPPREPERGPQQYRCTRDDIDESGGTA